jgi:uncharacterized BrkB/YihY/UPF0761 family membrane protein
MSDLRDLAKQRYREHDLRQIQIERARRFASAFLFGMAITLLVVMSISAVAQMFARPVTSQIERGLK